LCCHRRWLIVESSSLASLPLASRMRRTTCHIYVLLALLHIEPLVSRDPLRCLFLKKVVNLSTHQDDDPDDEGGENRSKM
jgi:hypothetical protein